MRFASFRHKGRNGLAVAAGAAAEFHGCVSGNPRYPGDLDTVIAGASDQLARVGAELLCAPVVRLAEVDLQPPLARPGKIICIGLNYADHAAEAGLALPTYPTVFARFASSLIGHGAAIVRPRASEQLDFEGEFVAVIGVGGRDIPRKRALSHVAGYSLFNDASIRDYQLKTSQWTVGKNFDSSGAFGPYFVSADELPPGCRGLRLRTRLNGQTVQDASTEDLIFDVETLVSMLSQAFALSPGDIIVTGTPSGVGLARKPPLWMKPGDICEVELEGLGTLSNPIAGQVV